MAGVPQRTKIYLLVAIPMTGHEEIAVDLIETKTDSQTISMRNDATPLGQMHFSYRGRSGDGVRWSRSEEPLESDILHQEILELAEDGTVRVFRSDLCTEMRGERLIRIGTLAQTVRAFVDYLAFHSSAMPYNGSWAIGLTLARAQGARARMPGIVDSYWLPELEALEYGKSLNVPTVRLKSAPGVTSAHLLAPILRSLSIAGHPSLAAYLEDSTEQPE